jgi:hypothetical protein
MTHFIIDIFTKYYCGDQIKEDGMSGTCSMHRGDKGIDVLVGKPDGKDHLEFLSVDGRATFKRTRVTVPVLVFVLVLGLGRRPAIAWLCSGVGGL